MVTVDGIGSSCRPLSEGNGLEPERLEDRRSALGVAAGGSLIIDIHNRAVVRSFEMR
jgi:hypothetical protein